MKQNSFQKPALLITEAVAHNLKKFDFILYSDLIQEEWNNTELYKKANESGALIKIDDYTNELILSKVSDELIIETINIHIEEIEPKNYHDQISPFDGGLRIVKNGMIIEHQCCSELNDYLNWKKIITDKTAKWKEVWIGHPSIYYRYNGNEIELSEYYDINPNYEDIEIKMTFEISEFLFNLEKALLELYKFKERVYKLIEQGNYQNKEILKKLLIE